MEFIKNDVALHAAPAVHGLSSKLGLSSWAMIAVVIEVPRATVPSQCDVVASMGRVSQVDNDRNESIHLMAKEQALLSNHRMSVSFDASVLASPSRERQAKE